MVPGAQPTCRMIGQGACSRLWPRPSSAIGPKQRPSNWAANRFPALELGWPSQLPSRFSLTAQRKEGMLISLRRKSVLPKAAHLSPSFFWAVAKFLQSWFSLKLISNNYFQAGFLLPDHTACGPPLSAFGLKAFRAQKSYQKCRPKPDRTMVLSLPQQKQVQKIHVMPPEASCK